MHPQVDALRNETFTHHDHLRIANLCERASLLRQVRICMLYYKYPSLHQFHWHLSTMKIWPTSNVQSCILINILQHEVSITVSQVKLIFMNLFCSV